LAIVSPLSNDDGGLRFEENACAAIYLIRVEDETQYVAQGRRAQMLFNLTSAEGEILSLFLAGRSLRDIADERRTATVTVRTQLKSIMHKTHSRHQLDLLRFRRLAP
jgi:DNA-binding CsgD family transcriptional regulator